MVRWWTKPPVIVAAVGILAVLSTAFLPRTTITQHTSGAGSPAIGSARDVTITQQPTPQPPAGQSPATLPSPLPTPQGNPWWQQPPVIAGIITAVATLVAAFIPRVRSTPSGAPKSLRKRS